jgi:hypothetical protein
MYPVKPAFLAGALAVGLLLGHGVSVRAQAAPASGDFHSMSAQLSGDREGAQIGQPIDTGADRALEERALNSLDAIALKALNAGAVPDLVSLNKNLGGLVAAENPTGEDYEVVELAGVAPTYALVANFGLAGPSAIRLYAGAPGQFALVGRIDCYNPPKFFDEYLALVPIIAPETVFMTVAGRTDDLQTGLFTVWYFDGQELHQVWNSDLLAQSTYETDEAGVHLTFCAKPDNDHPEQCARMVRDTFSWQDVAWKPRETKILGRTKPDQ